MTRFYALSLALCLSGIAACGGKDDAKNPSDAKADVSLDDAISLLPSSPVAVGTVDARAYFGSATFGADLSKLVEQYLPIGAEAGFQASRDVDRVTFGSYSYSGLDVAAILIGKFDEAKIKVAAQKQTPTKGGGVIVASQYAGRDVYTVNNVGFTILTSTRAIAGTEAGIRRVLERIQDRRVKRDVPKWMLDTLETPGASAAVAVDLATQPIPPETMRQIPVAFLQNAKQIRALWQFKDSGVQLAGSLTYADAATAATATDQVKQSAGYLKYAALIGIKVQNVDVKNEKEDVQVKLSVDEQSLRTVLSMAPQFLGGGK